MKLKLEMKTPSEVSGVAEKVLGFAGNHRLLAFYGDMGVGKTTLIRAICDQLGVVDTTSSPTFALVNQYLTSSNLPVYHMDVYRIETIEEMYDLGYEEYFYSAGYCFVEWADKIDVILPQERVDVYLSADGKKRTVEMAKMSGNK